ncbi:MAG: hypothetical protein NTZ90_16365 [Proteobacteria bacterium]|nr:hypothetical protein [Pseudomonadota bacterium]
MPTKSSWDLTPHTEGDRLAWRNKLTAYYDAADWLTCYQEAKAMVTAYPLSVTALISRAALLGDSAEVFPPGPERRRRKAAAIRQLRHWVHTPPIKLPRALASYARNELYYHSRMFKEQAILGRAAIKAGEPLAAYMVGVGAAFYAAELMRYGQRVRATRWATESLEAWQAYFALPKTRDRFDTHVFKATSLAVLGRVDEAEAELKTVAALIGKDIRTTTIYDVKERLSWCRRGISAHTPLQRP